MHFYHSRIFIFFVVVVFLLNFALCGESERPAEEREPPGADRRRDSSVLGSGRGPPSLRFIRRREVPPPLSVRALGSGVDDIIDAERSTNAEIGSNLKNKTVKKQLKKQEDGTDVVQNPAVKNSTVSDENGSDKNSTLPSEPDRSSDPGAKTRGVIVFGSLGLFSFAYLAYKIYSKRKRDGDSGHNSHRGDLQQFKYGVLTSSEAEDNLELARLPSTVESDEEEIEMFDLESQRRPDGKGGRITEEDPPTRDVLVLDSGSSRSTLTGDDDLLDLREGGSRPVPAPAGLNTTEGDFNSRRVNNENFFDIL